MNIVQGILKYSLLCIWFNRCPIFFTSPHCSNRLQVYFYALHSVPQYACPSSHLHNVVLVTVALWYVLKWASLSLPTLCFFLTLFWPCWTPSVFTWTLGPAYRFLQESQLWFDRKCFQPVDPFGENCHLNRIVSNSWTWDVLPFI